MNFYAFEVFSGSGENIRYQVAGGQVSGANRIPAHIKPVKMMNWNFDGEFWEDEIGSYRSSLQNNCPRSQAARKAEAPGATKPAAQAVTVMKMIRIKRSDPMRTITFALLFAVGLAAQAKNGCRCGFGTSEDQRGQREIQ